MQNLRDWILKSHTLLILYEPVQFWQGLMLLFFEGFQRQNVLILFLVFLKDPYLVTAKITPDDGASELHPRKRIWRCSGHFFVNTFFMINVSKSSFFSIFCFLASQSQSVISSSLVFLNWFHPRCICKVCYSEFWIFFFKGIFLWTGANGLAKNFLKSCFRFLNFSKIQLVENCVK